MAVTITAKSGLNVGPGLRIQFYSITLDTSYAATNGETVSMATELPTEVFGAEVIGHTKGFIVSYKRATSGAPTTGTLQVYYELGKTTGVKAQLCKVATGTNLASINFYIMATGK